MQDDAYRHTSLAHDEGQLMNKAYPRSAYQITCRGRDPHAFDTPKAMREDSVDRKGDPSRKNEISRKALLDLHLSAITESQKRARLALFLATLASAAIFAVEWNSYLSWDRQWAELEQSAAPTPWARAQLLQQQIQSWVETTAVNVPVIGLRVSVSDAAVLGSIILLVAAFYLRMTSKRENLVIASALKEALSGSRDDRKYVSVHIGATAVFDRLDEREGPVTSLYQPPSLRRPLVSSTHGFLMYLPALTIFAVVLTDAYYAFGYLSPWRGNNVAGLSDLPRQYLIQLVAMDIFALIYGTIATAFCASARQYQIGTQKVVAQFKNGAETQPAGHITTITRVLTLAVVVHVVAVALRSLWEGNRRRTARHQG